MCIRCTAPKSGQQTATIIVGNVGPNLGGGSGDGDQDRGRTLVGESGSDFISEPT